MTPKERVEAMNKARTIQMRGTDRAALPASLLPLLDVAMHGKYVESESLFCLPLAPGIPSAPVEDKTLKQLQDEEDRLFLVRRIAQLETKLTNYYARKERMEYLGQRKETLAYRGLVYDIGQAERELKDHKEELAELG